MKKSTSPKKMAKKRRDKNSMDILNNVVNNTNANRAQDQYGCPAVDDDVNKLADFPDLMPSKSTPASSSSSSTNWVVKSKKSNSEFSPWIKTISLPLAPVRKYQKKIKTEDIVVASTSPSSTSTSPSLTLTAPLCLSTATNSFVTSTDLFLKLKLIQNQSTPVLLGFGELSNIGSSLGLTYKPAEKGLFEELEVADEQINVDLVLESTLDELISPSINPGHLPYFNFDTLLKMREQIEILYSVTRGGIDGYIENSSHWSCLICNVNHRDIVLQPCKHQAVCQKCCLRVSRCPVCKKFIKNRIISSATPYDNCDWISKLSDTPISLLV